MWFYVAFLLLNVFVQNQVLADSDAGTEDHAEKLAALLRSGSVSDDHLTYYLGNHKRSLRALRNDNDPITLSIRKQMLTNLNPIKIGVMREGREHVFEPFKRHHHHHKHHKNGKYKAIKHNKHHGKHHHGKHHHGKHHIKHHHGKHHNKHHHGKHHEKHHHGKHHEKHHHGKHHEKHHHEKHHSKHHQH